MISITKCCRKDFIGGSAPTELHCSIREDLKGFLQQRQKCWNILMMNTFHNQAGIFPAYIAIDSIGGISFCIRFYKLEKL